MKTILSLLTVLLLSVTLMESTANAQSSRDLQYFRAPDKTGLNVFETSKDTNVVFDGLNVRIGGSNTLQFQALTQSGDFAELHELIPNFNLATSNLDFDVQLHNGLRMHLRTYLSSRHHAEAWVKGGYMQVDRLDFIQEGFLEELMDKVTIRVGHMQVNYGDTHFRRSDNGQAIFNPFVGNYIMDSFTTEVAGEVYFQHNGFLAMVGLTNGKLNQSTKEAAVNTRASFIGKLGFDRQINPDLRFRLTGSLYTTGQAAGLNLYTGDRAGARYYDIFEDNRMSGRVGPDFSIQGVGGEMTAFMINPFIKYQGLEFFGVFENASGNALNGEPSRTYNQYGAELLYRFGANENIYLGGRYNLVKGEQRAGNDIEVERFNIGGGWFLTNNVLAKIEYVNQTYDGYPAGDLRENGKFSGIMLEAVISF
ncbi:MAG: hypothetical protein JJU13_00110 [Balneolaceae bacterium]|nr:hypothetical protein [Balneolaceae bacterium]